MMTAPLVEVRNLRKFFPIRRGFFGWTAGWVKAVDDVSLDIPPGRTTALVGESGCGKTTLARCLLRLLEPTSGRVLFRGIDLTRLKGSELRTMRRRMQIVFQDPYSSLNPRLTVGSMLREILRFHHLASGDDLSRRVAEILRDVGLSPTFSERYPHEFSGGQRQRIGVARALSVQPEFVVLDEPVSALDVSIQAQVLNLLIDLQERHSLTYLFIAHDLSLVEHIADLVAVMYLGRVVEAGPKTAVLRNPLHPYTQALLASVPIPDPDRRRELRPPQGDPPSPAAPPNGCHFHPRCPSAGPECRSWRYRLTAQPDGRQVACLRYETG